MTATIDLSNKQIVPALFHARAIMVAFRNRWTDLPQALTGGVGKGRRRHLAPFALPLTNVAATAVPVSPAPPVSAITSFSLTTKAGDRQ